MRWIKNLDCNFGISKRMKLNGGAIPLNQSATPKKPVVSYEKERSAFEEKEICKEVRIGWQNHSAFMYNGLSHKSNLFTLDF